MKGIKVCLILPVVIVAALGLFGCASSKAPKTESLLSAAGFHNMTPKTPQQQACYNALPGFKLQRKESGGKVVYAYADKKAGIVYVGGEEQYQQYKKLAQQQRIADEQLQAAQMNEDASMNWGFWGPAGTWFY